MASSITSGGGTPRAGSKGHGAVERVHQTLLGVMSKMIEEEARLEKKKWVDLVPFATMAYNSAVHSALSEGSTGISPAEAFLGRRIDVLPSASITKGW